MKRSLSHSEVSSALDCQLRHDYAYSGRVVGDALEPKHTAPRLRAGRAWGRAVAAWHEHADELLAAEHADVALTIALSLDRAEQERRGVFDASEFERLDAHLRGLLADYIAHADRLSLTRPEHQLRVPIPSRSSSRASSVYELLAYLDGVHTDAEGRDWIVEFKLRGQLQSLELISKSRQLRWYAWAWRRSTGRAIAGIIVDERLDAIPAAVRRNKDDSISRVQSCRPQTYLDAGGAEPDVLAQLQAKRWEQRHPLKLTEFELDEAGWQLTSAARLIHDLDAGVMYPIRNPSPARCPSCQFKDICTSPHDDALIDALYDRVPVKRNREDIAA